MDAMRSYQIIRVAKKYYELHMGQMEIAQEEGVSKSTISRMLQKAMDLGYIKVKVDAPTESLGMLEDEVRELFQLKEVFVTPNLVDNDEIIMQDTCRALARNLDSYIKDNSIVGVSWGKTMNCLVKEIDHIRARNIKVVQLNGGIAKSASLTGAAQIVDALTKAGNGVGYMFPVPAIVDSKLISTVLKGDSQVQGVLKLAEQAQTAIFSIGALTKQSILYEVGYLKDEDYRSLKEAGAVGDIACRFYDIHGKVADKGMNERAVGLELEELKKKEWSIAISVGSQKVESMVGALKGGYINVLYTDEKTAKALLDTAGK